MHRHIRMLSLRTCAAIYARYFWEYAPPIRTFLLGNFVSIYARYLWEYAPPYTHVTTADFLFGNNSKMIYMFVRLYVCTLVVQDTRGTKIFATSPSYLYLKNI